MQCALPRSFLRLEEVRIPAGEWPPEVGSCLIDFLCFLH